MTLVGAQELLLLYTWTTFSCKAHIDHARCECQQQGQPNSSTPCHTIAMQSLQTLHDEVYTAFIHREEVSTCHRDVLGRAWASSSLLTLNIVHLSQSSGKDDDKVCHACLGVGGAPTPPAWPEWSSLMVGYKRADAENNSPEFQSPQGRPWACIPSAKSVQRNTCVLNDKAHLYLL